MKNLELFLQQYSDNIYYSIDDQKSASIAIGCELNFVEVEKIKHIVSQYLDNFVIINTCAVHEKNINISKNIVERIVKKCTNTKIFIVGCAAKLFENMQSNNIILINNDHKLDTTFYKQILGTSIGHIQSENYIGKIKIQNGCNSNCTYCIIPQLRGRSQSEEYTSIKKEISENIQAGVRDICLVGVNITQYSEPQEKYGLYTLVKNILHDFPDINSLNLDSLDPAYLEIFDLIELIKNENRMRKEIYLATQSGSNKILKAMRRCHTREKILDIIKKAYNIEIRHDFIVGFPGETEEDFDNSLQIMRLTQNKETYGVISEYTNHYNTQENIIEESVIHNRKQILENTKHKIINLINEPNKILKIDLDSMPSNIDGYNTIELDVGNIRDNYINSIQTIKHWMDCDKIKEIFINADISEILVDWLKILINNKPRYQKIILHTKDNIDTIKEMFPDIIICQKQ